MDRFEISYNPFKQQTENIIHRLYPRCYIECRWVDEKGMDDNINNIFDIFHHRNTKGFTETWQLIVSDFFDHKGIDDVPDEEVPKYRHTLERAWRWYRSYLKQADEAEDNEEYGKKN